MDEKPHTPIILLSSGSLANTPNSAGSFWGLFAFGFLVLFAVLFFARYPHALDVFEDQQQIVLPGNLLPLQTITLGFATIHVFTARTSYEREVGLSGKTPLTRDTGMLFFFHTPDDYANGIPAAPHPIDVIWFDEDWKIVDMTLRMLPASGLVKISPKMPAKYMLEVSAGSAEVWGWKEGLRAKFQPLHGL